MKTLKLVLWLFLSFPFLSLGQTCQQNLTTPTGISPSLNPAYVKYYLHVIRDNSGQGGASQSQINAVISELEGSIFTDHDIYLGLGCINEINNTALLIDGCLINAHYGTYSFPDGLNIYLTTGSCGSVFGNAVRPGNNCWINVAMNIDNTAAHEVGHNLGLIHTFGGSSECADGSNCTTAGDQICDTPADPYPSGLNCFNSSACTYDNMCLLDQNGSCATQAYFDFDPSIMMSYYHGCYTRFTEGQAEIMRGSVNGGPVSFVSQGPFYITQPTIWSTPQQFDVDVIIKSGGDLTISTQVLMGPGRRILLESDASLTVDAGHITVGPGISCTGTNEDFWGGIGIGGGNSWIDILNGSIIELAEKGVHYTTPDNSVETSNVRVRDSEFRNNLQAVNMWSTLTAPYVNFLTTNSDYVVNSNFPGQISQHLSFANAVAWIGQSSTIENQTPEFDANDIGVACYNTRYLQRSSNIEGFYTGLDLKTVGSNETFFIRQGCLFRENHFDVFSQGVDNFVVEDSYFELGNLKNDSIFQPIAINSIWGNGFEILNNQFSDPVNTIGGVGTFTNSTGTPTSTIRGNTFTSMSQGSYSVGFNSGLELWCNEYTGLNTDVLVQNGGIHASQGNASDPAGNVFGNSLDIFNNGSMIDYYYSTVVLAEFPDNISGSGFVFTNGVNRLSCGSGLPGPGEGTEGSYEDQYTDLLNQFTPIQQQYKGLIDDGNTDLLLQAIVSADLTNASIVLDQLNSISPFVSFEAISAIYRRTDLFSDQEIFDVINANKDNLFVPGIKEVLYHPENQINTALLNDLFSDFEPTSRTPLEVSLRSIRSQMYQIAQKALREEYLNTTSDINYEYLRSWYERLGGYQGEVQIVGSYLKQRDLQNARARLSSISARIELSEAESMDLLNMEVLMDILMNAFEEDRYEGSLTLEEQGTLINIAEESTGLASIYAQNILEFFYDYSFHQSNLSDAGDGHLDFEQYVTPQYQDDEKSVMTISPNPADDILNVQFSFAPVKGKILLMTIDGAIKKSLDISSSSVSMEIGDLPPGVYFILFKTDEGKVNESMFVIR
jgi:hypothetical protein